MTIGEVARRTGVSVKALRFYDGLGILEVAGRSDANYRLFGEAALRCVDQIRRLQAEGITLRELRAIVQGRRRGEDALALLRGAYAAALARTERDLAILETRRAMLRVLVAAGDGDLTFQHGGGCNLCEGAPRDAAPPRRYPWPVTRAPSNGSAASSRAERETVRASIESRPFSR